MPWALSIETGNFVNLSKQVQPENRNISGHHFEATFGMNGEPCACLAPVFGFIPALVPGSFFLLMVSRLGRGNIRVQREKV